MRRLFFLLLAGVSLLSACKKQKTDDDYLKIFRFDIKNHDVVFGFKKVHFLTDSVYFQFSTIAPYDCDKYRINSGVQDDGKNFSMLLGNIYKDGAQCVYGSFPATATFKSAALPNGMYKIIVKKNGVDFDGELRVTNTEYIMDWVHDEHCMKWEPKTYIR
jgi:hypothetical protein